MLQAEEQKCKGPEASVCLACSVESKGHSRAGAELVRESPVGLFREVKPTRTCSFFTGCVRGLHSFSEQDGNT